MTQLADLESISVDDLKSQLWHIGDLSWKLDALQKTIKKNIESTSADKCLVLSSRQIGKSYVSIVYALEFCIRNPGVTVRVLAPTLKQVSDIVQDNLAPITRDAPYEFIRRAKSEYRWMIGPPAKASTLRLGSLERDHVDNSRGGNASLVIYEEGGFVTSDDYRYAVESVLGPQLLRSQGKEIHISSPSEEPEHYLHTVVKPYCEERDTFHSYTLYDSPSVTPRMIEKAIERCGGRDTESFRREYMAEILRSTQVMVIPEFNSQVHTAEFALLPPYHGLLSIDVGGIKDKTALLLCYWDFKQHKFKVFDEALFDANVPTQRFVESARHLLDHTVDNPHITPIYADMPGQLQVDLIHDHNLVVKVPAKDDRDAAVAHLRLAFSRDEIIIHDRCKHLIGCLKTARYNDKRTDFVRTDLYGHADPLMALVYAYRMIDKVTNPYPARTITQDQIFLPHRQKDFDQYEQLQKGLVKWNPMKR
jgi:hypothetical protein